MLPLAIGCIAKSESILICRVDLESKSGLIQLYSFVSSVWTDKAKENFISWVIVVYIVGDQTQKGQKKSSK